MSRSTPQRTVKNPLLWSIALIAIGGVLLLHSLLFLENISLVSLSPLLLVFIGAQVLLKGDFVPSTHTRTFGITRGGIESATLEINASEIDVALRSLPSDLQERLIAGQYASQSRPELLVDGTQAQLKFDRAKTNWFSFADWELGLAQAMPWAITISTSLGQLDIDLADIILETASFYSGVGDARLILPKECLGDPIRVQTTLGNIHLITPLGYRVQVLAKSGRFTHLHIDETRYTLSEDGTWLANNADEDAPLVIIQTQSHFGDVYLA